MADFETPPLQPEHPLSRLPSMHCPDCHGHMEYRGERANAIARKVRDHAFYCPVCEMEILRPHKV